MKIIIGLAALGLFTGKLSLADDQKSNMERVTQFYAKNIGGVILEMEKPAQAKVTQGAQTFLIDYTRKVRFSKIKLTKTGFTFDITSDIVNTSTKLDEAGNPTKEVTTNERHLTHRYAMSERKSSDVNNVLGFIYITKDSNDESTGIAFSVNAEIGEDRLTFKDNMLMYSDESLDGGETLFPGATGSEMTLSLVNGKLKMDQAYTLYEVNPKTFEGVALNDDKGEPMAPAHVIAVQK